MSYLSFENNIIEASGNLILKSTSGSIDCSGATISNVTIAGNMVVTSIEPSNHDISFNGSNLLDVSSIQVNNDVSCSSLIVDTISSNSDLIVINKDVRIDASLVINDGNVTLIHTKDLDISDNIIGLNRGHVDKVDKTSGMLINYSDASNIFFGYHENAFVIADTSYNHDDVTRNIILDKYVDLKVGKFESIFDGNNRLFSNFDSSGCYLEWKSLSSQASIGFPSSGSSQLHITCENGFYINGTSAFTGPITAPNFKTSYGKNMIWTQIDSSNSFLNIKRFDINSDTNLPLCRLGYTNETNNIFHIISDTHNEHIQLKRQVSSGVHPHLNIGVNDGGVYKHESNVMIEAPSLHIPNSIDNHKLNIYYNTINTNDQLTLVGRSGANNEVKMLIGYNGDRIKSNAMIEAPSFNATSDYRTKTNIEELDENISVSNLRPLVYIKNGQKEIGLIAHELQEVYPFMVCGEKDGEQMQSVNYNGLISVLINDVKRLNNENQKLKSEYHTLKSEINEIKSRFDSLEEKLNKKFE